MESTYDKIQYYEFGRKEKARVVSKLKELLDKEGKVKLALLFGSITRRGYVRDIDVAIVTAPRLDFKELLNLNAQVELEMGVPTDIVELSDLPASLKASILKNGLLLKGTRTQQKQLLNRPS
jgi:predicted nucleotidyltransferase